MSQQQPNDSDAGMSKRKSTHIFGIHRSSWNSLQGRSSGVVRLSTMSAGIEDNGKEGEHEEDAGRP